MSEQQPPPATPAPTPETTDGSDDRNLAVLAHILGFFTNVLAPLIIWLLKKDSSKFIDHHGKQALNFQITMLIGYVVGSVTAFILVGCVIVVIVAILNIIFTIIAAIAASKGEWYRYPVAIQILK